MIFVLAFGRMFLDQVAQLLEALPSLVDRVIGRQRGDHSAYDSGEILAS